MSRNSHDMLEQSLGNGGIGLPSSEAETGVGSGDEVAEASDDHNTTTTTTTTLAVAGAAFLNTNPSVSSSFAPSSRRGSRSNQLTAGFSLVATTASRVNNAGQHHHLYPSRQRGAAGGSRRARRWRGWETVSDKERNYPAAVCEALVIATLCTALAAPRWLSVRGGGCSQGDLGVSQFFYVGNFLLTHHRVAMDNSVHKPSYIYQYSASFRDILVDCVDPKTVQILRSMIILCFLGILSSGFAFFLDLLGPKSTVLKFMRRNAIWNITAVIICVTVNGFCFWVTQRVFEVQTSTKLHTGSKVLVHFDVGFYLVAAAGAMAVLAAGCNCLRRYPTFEREHQTGLLDDYDGIDAQTSAFFPPVTNVLAPPPPAYSP